MNVCIEISTFNNKELLKIVLERLALQSYPAEKFKVVLSDDGSSDGLPELVESICHTMPYEIVLLKNQHQGAAETHNQGIRACDDGLIIMMAADILVCSDFIQMHVNTHQQYPADNVVVAGRLVQSPELPQTVFQQSWDKLINHLFSTEKKDLRHQGFFVSNLSFKKSFMIKHGMFLNWPAAAQEDIELGYRLAENGMQLIRNNQALGYHHHQASLQSVARRAYMEGYNWHYFAQHMQDLWVRLKTCDVTLSDGLSIYLNAHIKKIIRRIIINRISIKIFVVPLIKAAERFNFLSPLVPVLAGKVATYYFHLGFQDYKNKLPWDDREIST